MQDRGRTAMDRGQHRREAPSLELATNDLTRYAETSSTRGTMYTSLGLSTAIVAYIARLDSQNTDNPQGGKREEKTSIAYHDARIRLLNLKRAIPKHHRPRSSKQSRRVTAHEFTRAHKENRRPIGSMLRNPQRSASLPQKGHEVSRKVARIRHQLRTRK
jgi:hypothetical protein